MKLLIVGCGYVGNQVARLFPDATVYAMTRTEERGRDLEERGIYPLVGDWFDSTMSALTDLASVDFILVAIPHRESHGYAEHTHSQGLSNLLKALPADWKKLIYLSTTGVYGDCNHESVNEDTPPSPTRIGPKIAVAAEEMLKAKLSLSQLAILRLAGIYGPGRIPLANRLQAGEPLAVPLDGFLNLVHVSDIAGMVRAVFMQDMRRKDYVFSDGNPVQRADFYPYLARLCGVSEPRFVSPDGTDSRSRRATSKRVDPSAILGETGYGLAFPSYVEGLKDALSDGEIRMD